MIILAALIIILAIGYHYGIDPKGHYRVFRKECEDQ